MNKVGDILCMRITTTEDFPFKIKSLVVETEEAKKQLIKFETNRILKCGKFCSAVYCKDKANIQTAKGEAKEKFLAQIEAQKE